MKEGLPSSVVYSVVQDKDGFMWFGTEAGLSRFDGVNFKNFTIEDGLPDNEILKLFVDSKNRIWIIPFKNAICYYYKGRIHNVDNDHVLRTIKLSGLPISIAEDDHGDIIILETQKIHYLHNDSLFRSTNLIFGKEFRGLQVGVDSLGKFLIGAEVYNARFALVAYSPQNESIQRSYYSGPSSVNSVILKKEIYVYRDFNRLVVWRHKDSFSLPLPPNFISVSSLGDSMVCMNTSAGSYIYNLNQSRLTDLFLKNEGINTVFSDDEDNWWFATSRGVFRLLSKTARKFTFEGKGKPSYSIYCIDKIDSTFYFGTDSYGLITMKGDKYQMERISPGFTSGRITAIDKYKSDSIILGTDEGIFVLGRSNPRVFSASIKSVSLLPDHLLSASNNGVFIHGFPEFTIVDTIWSSRATSAWESSGTIYIGTLNGLYRVAENRATTFLGEKAKTLASKISVVKGGKNNMLWVGTYGYGLVGLENDTIRYIINSNQGLSSNTCRAIFVDSNVVWVATDKGLDKIHPTSAEIRVTNFTIADGLPSSVINSIYVDRNIVYVGSSEGIARFDASKAQQASACRVRLTKVQIGLDKTYYDTTNFHLPHNYVQLRFDYSGISFRSSGDIAYYYRLLGLNSSWQKTSSNFLGYPSLPSGNYTLELYALNKFGVKSNLLSIPFSVNKLFRETLLFQGLLIFLILLCIWAIITIRIRWLRKKQRAEQLVKERITELEQMALKAQMNPHFIFNCLNSIQQYVLEKDFEGVNKFLSDFAGLIRKTLDTSAKKEITLEEELEYISTYLRLERSRLENKFSFDIVVDEEVNPTDYYLPPMILQPCLENSIRHGIKSRPDNLGKINVHIGRDDAYLVCIIEDNGVGMKLAQEYKSLKHIEYQSKGMELTINRIEMLSLTSEKKAKVKWEDILNAKGEVEGTRVTIQFPV